MKNKNVVVFALAALLGTILQMSDEVKDASSPLDTQGKLLRMQNSIQENKTRMRSVMLEALEIIGRPPSVGSGCSRNETVWRKP